MSNNWWADKLSGATPSTPPSTPPATIYAPQAPQQPQQPQYQQPQAPQPRIPQSSQTNTSCPECRGPNYAKTGSMPTQNGAVDTYRCYDCGYPLVQSGSGFGGVNVPSAGPTQASKQVATGGWNPTTIIGKLE